MAAAGVVSIIDAVAVIIIRVKIIVADAVVMTWLLFFLEIMPHLSAKHECNVLMHSSGREEDKSGNSSYVIRIIIIITFQRFCC